MGLGFCLCGGSIDGGWALRVLTNKKNPGYNPGFFWLNKVDHLFNDELSFHQRPMSRKTTEKSVFFVSR